MRKVWLVAVLIILAVLVCSTSACLAQWYKGIIHCHSTYSDGSVSLDEIWQEGSRLGLDFIFMTDHVDCFGEDVDHSIGANFIFPEFHSPVAHRHPNPNYYDTYVYHCQELSPKGRPLIIPGIEFPCSDYKLSRHMLLLGLDQEGDPHAGLSVPAKYWYLPYRPLDEIPVLQILWDQFRLDESKQPIAVVIAHPSLWNPPFDFPSYKTIDSPEADGPLFSPIDAIEFFHPSPRAKEEIQLALYQQFLRWRPDIFLPGVAVTCGNDMHYTEVGLKHNYTFIQADGIDRNDLINGILSGKSYASAWSGKVENISFPTPAGFYPLGDEEYEIYTDQQPIKISFGIVWPNPLLADKEIKLLLDGVELPGSSQRHIIVPLTTNTLSFSSVCQNCLKACIPCVFTRPVRLWGHNFSLSSLIGRQFPLLPLLHPLGLKSLSEPMIPTNTTRAPSRPIDLAIQQMFLI